MGLNRYAKFQIILIVAAIGLLGVTGCELAPPPIENGEQPGTETPVTPGPTANLIYHVVDVPAATDPMQVKSIADALALGCPATAQKNTLLEIVMDKGAIDYTTPENFLMFRCPTLLRKGSGLGIIGMQAQQASIFVAAPVVFQNIEFIGASEISMTFQYAASEGDLSMTSELLNLSLNAPTSTVISISGFESKLVFTGLTRGRNNSEARGPEVQITLQGDLVKFVGGTIGTVSVDTDGGVLGSSLAAMMVNGIVAENTTFKGTASLSNVVAQFYDTEHYGNLDIASIPSGAPINSSFGEEARITLARPKFYRWRQSGANDHSFASLFVTEKARVSAYGGSFVSASGSSVPLGDKTVISDGSIAGGGLVNNPISFNGVGPNNISTTIDYDGNGCADFPESSNMREMQTDMKCVVDGHAPPQ